MDIEIPKRELISMRSSDVDDQAPSEEVFHHFNDVQSAWKDTYIAGLPNAAQCEAYIRALFWHGLR